MGVTVQGPVQTGTEAVWLPEEGIRDSFTPLPLDVFRALWETHEGRDCRPWPASPPSKGGQDHALRIRAFHRISRLAHGSGGHPQVLMG